MHEQRDIRFLTIPQDKFADSSEVAEPDIQAYYDEHQNKFLSAETVDLDFIKMAPDDFREPVDESAILEAYELEKQAARYQAQNRVSHILFTDEGEGSVDTRLAQAQERLAQGVAFADVAKEFSDDAGSAQNGGDLGFSSGDAFPEEMEAALSELAVATVSAPVETDAGTHLLFVTERNAAEAPSLESVRERLVESLQLAEAKVSLLRTVESLKDLTFNADDLSTPAKDLGLKVEKAVDVTRSTREGLFAHPRLLEAAFSTEVLEEGHNSDVLELADGQFVVLRVRRHQEPTVKALEEVREGIATLIQQDRTGKALEAEGMAIIEQLDAGASLEELAKVGDYQWQVELGVDRLSRSLQPELLQQLFAMPAPQGETAVAELVRAANGDSIVVQLVRVSEGAFESLEPAQQQRISQQIKAEFGGLLDSEHLRGLRQRAEINVL